MTLRKDALKKMFVLFFTGISLIMCFGGTAAAGFEAKKEGEVKEKKIVAKVNGQPIYDDALTSEVEHALGKFRKFGMQKEKDPSGLIKDLQKQALEMMISQEVLYQASQKLTIPKPKLNEKIQEKLDAMKKKYDSNEEFEKSLKARNLTEKELKESIKKSVYLDEYLKGKGISDPEVPEKEIRKYYEDNKSSFQREEHIKASHILIKVDENAAPEKKEEARKKAEKILQEIKDGKDFEATAKKYSDCNSASGGGDLGYIKRGYMPEEFDKVAFELEKNKVGGLVKTKYGYHIIKVFEKKPKGVAPYEDVKDFIAKFLKDGLSKQKLAALVGELREKAKVEILLNQS
jgi:peptidyl-prolyl cis-trans isomerase C